MRKKKKNKVILSFFIKKSIHQKDESRRAVVAIGPALFPQIFSILIILFVQAVEWTWKQGKTNGILLLRGRKKNFQVARVNEKKVYAEKRTGEVTALSWNSQAEHDAIFCFFHAFT